MREHPRIWQGQLESGKASVDGTREGKEGIWGGHCQWFSWFSPWPTAK